MGQSQSADTSSTSAGGNVVAAPAVPHGVRVHCIEVTTANMEKLEALLAGTADETPAAKAMRQRGLRTLSRTFDVPSDATVSVVRAALLTNGTCLDPAVAGSKPAGRFDVFALQRPLPSRLASVRASTHAATEAPPEVSQSYDKADLVPLPLGLPLAELAASEQFLTQFTDDAFTAEALSDADTAPLLSLTLFSRAEEGIFGACCYSWCCSGVCRACCCRACVCDACCAPVETVRVQPAGVRVIVNTRRQGPPRRRQNRGAPRRAMAARGTVLEYHGKHDGRSDDDGYDSADDYDDAGSTTSSTERGDNPLTPKKYAQATRSGGNGAYE